MADRPLAALVFNPAAGRGGIDIDRVKAALAERFVLRAYETSPTREAHACAREALAEGAEVVIGAGGDGTISAVGSALIGSSATLGVVPCGTANSIAGALGIPSDLEGALAVLLGREALLVDTARANGETMLLHASVGLHAATIADTAREAKNRWGVLAYAATAIEKLRGLDPFLVEIETEDEVIRCRATNVTAANLSPVRSIFAQGPSVISPEDGRLDLTIFAASTLAEAVLTGLHLFRTASRGEPVTRDEVGYLSARAVRITTDPAQPLLIDGEDAGSGPLQIECVPASLRVLVPAQEPRAKPDGEAAEKLEGLPELEVEPK